MLYGIRHNSGIYLLTIVCCDKSDIYISRALSKGGLKPLRNVLYLASRQTEMAHKMHIIKHLTERWATMVFYTCRQFKRSDKFRPILACGDCAGTLT